MAPPTNQASSASPPQPSLLSSVYYAAGAATGLFEGYLLLCRTLAKEVVSSNAKGGLDDGENCQAHQQDTPVDEEALSQRIMTRIASIPRALSAYELCESLQEDPILRQCLPDGVRLQVDFVDPDTDEVVPAEDVAQVLALQNGNGQLLTFEGLANGDLRSNNSQMIVRGAGWRQDDDPWLSGVGPVRHRRPAVARLCLSKYLMRNPNRC